VTTHTSEVARLREHIDLEEQASRLGLYGPAIVANHASNTVRMQQGAERILGLFRAGKHEEAEALMNTESWEGNDFASPTSDEVTPSV
jgi:hypothetical protein